MASMGDLATLLRNVRTPMTDPPDAAVETAHTFLGRIEIGVLRSAFAFIDDPEKDGSDDQRYLKWATTTVEDPRTMAIKVLNVIVGSNAAKNQAIAVIPALPDAEIQGLVNKAVPVLAQLSGGWV